MAIPLNEIFDLSGIVAESGAKITYPVKLSNGDVYIGYGQRIFKKADGETTFTQFYEAKRFNVNGFNDIVIPFVFNDTLYSIEYTDGSSGRSAYIKTDLENNPYILDPASFGTIIANIDNVSKCFAISKIGTKIVAVLQIANTSAKVISVDPVEYGVKTTEYINSLPDCHNAYVLDNKIYFQFKEDSLNFPPKLYSYSANDGVLAFRSPGSQRFGSHSFNGVNYSYGWSLSNQEVRLFDTNTGGATPIGTAQATGFEDAFIQPTDEVGFRFAGAEFIGLNYTNDFIYLAVTWKDDDTGNYRSFLSRYEKTTNVFELDVYEEPITYFIQNEEYLGIGLGSKFYTIPKGDSEPPPEPDPVIGFFDVPKMQSLSFSRALNKSQIEDGFFPDLSSHEQQKQQFSSFGYGFCYQQRIRQLDKLRVQYKSETSTIKTELVDEDDNVVNSFDSIEVNNLLSVSNFFSVSIQNNGAGQSRIYLSGFDTIPVIIDQGNTILEIINAELSAFNGTYTVQAVQVDPIINQEYLVIDKNYDVNLSQVIAEAGIIESTAEFNIYEATIDFNTVNEGNYYVKAYLDGFETETGFVSEPIRVQGSFKDTLKLNYSNFDNAFDIDYTSGIIHTIRPECIMFKRIPASNNTTIRNTDNSVKLLRAKPQRKFEIQFVMLPPYLLEKLAVALSHDVVTINGVEFICEEGLGEPEYIDRFGLASATAIVEQVGWFNLQNSDDIGGLETDGGLIVANDGFIKR